MNERIREIAKDACVLGDWGEDVSEGRFFITGNTKQMEKFAELIVGECLSYAKDGDLDFMKFMIKQNFGVEE